MSEFKSSFPNSRKVYGDGAQGVRVPMREIALERGASSIRVYDTSGPHGHDVKPGLPKLREPWVEGRLEREALRLARPELVEGRARSGHALAERRSGCCVTQLHYARKGEITPEMEFVAVREGLPADFVRDEVARGRAI